MVRPVRGFKIARSKVSGLKLGAWSRSSTQVHVEPSSMLQSHRPVSIHLIFISLSTRHALTTIRRGAGEIHRRAS